MGQVPTPLKPNVTPEERAAYRAYLVRLLGYDPALEPDRKDWLAVWTLVLAITVLLIILAVIVDSIL